MHRRLVDRSVGLALVALLPGLSAMWRLSLTGSGLETELLAWPKVAAYGASPWLYLLHKL